MKNLQVSEHANIESYMKSHSSSELQRDILPKQQINDMESCKKLCSKEQQEEMQPKQPVMKSSLQSQKEQSNSQCQKDVNEDRKDLKDNLSWYSMFGAATASCFAIQMIEIMQVVDCSIFIIKEQEKWMSVPAWELAYGMFIEITSMDKCQRFLHAFVIWKELHLATSCNDNAMMYAFRKLSLFVDLLCENQRNK